MTTYQIAILGHYYQPDLQGDEMPRIHCDDRNNPVEYDTIEEAREVIQEWDEGVYVLDHNESGRPTYLIVESVDGDYIHGGRNGDMSNYNWDNWEEYCFHAKDEDGNLIPDIDACGECNGCCELMINEDRQYLLSAAVYKS